MLAVKNILFIKDYHFDDKRGGNHDKFFIVIYKEADHSIIAPIPTSKDRIPEVLKAKRCIKEDGGNIHAYFMPQGHVVGTNGFAFDLDTFIHISSNYLQLRSIANITQKYIETNKAVLMGVLKDDEYCDLIYCIYKSKHCPMGVKAKFEKIIHDHEVKKAAST